MTLYIRNKLTNFYTKMRPCDTEDEHKDTERKMVTLRNVEREQTLRLREEEKKRKKEKRENGPLVCLSFTKLSKSPTDMSHHGAPSTGCLGRHLSGLCAPYAPSVLMRLEGWLLDKHPTYQLLFNNACQQRLMGGSGAHIMADMYLVWRLWRHCKHRLWVSVFSFLLKILTRAW